MDTSEYDTNALLVNNISSITFRVLELPTNTSQKTLSTALEVENSLRGERHAVIYDASRQALWHFHVTNKEGASLTANIDTDKPICIVGQTLSLAEEGLLDLEGLQKNRSQPPRPNATSISSSSTSTSDQIQRPGAPKASQGSTSQSSEQDVQTTNGLPNIESKTTEPPPKTVYDRFIAAILLGISSAFCGITGAISLDYRTLLLPSDYVQTNSEHQPRTHPVTLALLRAYVTTTGALVISCNISRCSGLAPIDDANAPNPVLYGHNVVAAPFGVFAYEQPPASEEGYTVSAEQTPSTHAVIAKKSQNLHDQFRKQSCLKLIQSRGVPAPTVAGCSWISLYLPQSKLLDTKQDVGRFIPRGTVESVPWPQPLCFRRKALEVSSTSRIDDSLLSGYEESHDPLGGARRWFTAASERDDKIAKRKADRAAATSTENSGSDVKATRPSGQSPLALRRPSITGASSMYPTPPDAIQNLNGVTPSLDGTLSSPKNPLSATVAADTESMAPTTGMEVFDDSADGTDSKRLRVDSNLLGEADNMFEDISGGMFDDNDITEADFSFFDEQPGGMNIDFELDQPKVLPPAEASEPMKAENENIKTPKAETPQPSHDRQDAVFAKPELRHARSSRNGDAALPSKATVRWGSSKRESSPFDPQSVFKRVRASLVDSGRDRYATNPAIYRTKKVFERIDFDPRIPMISKKYEKGGMFDFDNNATSPKQSNIDQAGILEADRLKLHSTQIKKGKERPRPSSSLMQTLTKLEAPSMENSPSRMEDEMTDDDDSSLESDPDDSSYASDILTSPIKSSVKLAAVDDDVASQATSLKDLDSVDDSSQQPSFEYPKLFSLESPEVQLPTLFADPELALSEMPLSDQDLIQIAQLLTDQAATGCLRIGETASDFESSSLLEQRNSILEYHTRRALEVIGRVVTSFLGEASPVRFKSLLDIQDVPFQGQPSRLQPLQPRAIPGRDGNPQSIPNSNIYQIPCPHLEVRRADVKLSILPSAVTFWESLGLGPTGGIKDVNAVCVFPQWKGMVENVKTFLGRLKSVYEMMRLGSFERMPLSSELEDGILPYEVDRISTSPDASMTGYSSSLAESMETLRAAAYSIEQTGTNLVIYFVYSQNNPRTIMEACTAFLRFFESYQRTLAAKKESADNEIVLQLVSADMLSSATSLVVTPVAEVGKLCMEIYDRCMTFLGPMPAPGIILEQPLPRIIDFKLTNSPSASLIHENSCIHVAYSLSVDGRWISAAWTDDRGNQQATASYCSGRKGKSPSRTMSEVAHEIWESTLELISVWKVHWRIIITKCGPMDQHEMEFWVDLARTEIKASVTMILMTVDTDPSLQLLPSNIKLSPPSGNLYTTPVSTPQANIVSPDQSATPATPARDQQTVVATPGADNTGETDSESFLADVTDQTWGAIVGHRLNNSASTMRVQPTLASGYLVKRTGTKWEDAPVLMEVNLVHTEASPRAYEPLLREMLSYFRCLGTLARARGVVERETDVRPWHVAAAEKAARVLHLLM